MSEWKSTIVNSLKKELEITKMINVSVKNKFKELDKSITETTELKNIISKSPSYNQIEINSKIITFEFNQVMDELINEFHIKPLETTQENVDSVIENILVNSFTLK